MNSVESTTFRDLINLLKITHGILNTFLKCLLLIKNNFGKEKPASNFFFLPYTRRDETPLIVVTLSIAIVIKVKI